MPGGRRPHAGEQDREGGIRALPGAVGQQAQAVCGECRQEVSRQEDRQMLHKVRVKVAKVKVGHLSSRNDILYMYTG